MISDDNNKIHTSATDLRNASSSALQQDAGTGEDGNSRRKNWKIARTLIKKFKD